MRHREKVSVGSMEFARLTEDEVASLNLLMQKHNCTNLSDFIRAIIGSKVEVKTSPLDLDNLRSDLNVIKQTLLTIVNNLQLANNMVIDETSLGRALERGFTSPHISTRRNSRALIHTINTRRLVKKVTL